MNGYFVHNPEEAKEYQSRYKILYLTISITFIIFATRLWFLQLIQGHELREFSEKNRIKETKIIAPRGLMLDREGRVLVENQAGYEVILYPQYAEHLEETAHAVGKVLSIDSKKIMQKVARSKRQNGPFFQVKIKENLTREEVFRLKRMRLDHPGLDIIESVVRSYPLKEDGAQLFGYVGEISKRQIPNLNEQYKGKMSFQQGDIIGKNGLEETLELDIRGKDGIAFVQVDAHGREATAQTPNIFGEQIQDQEAKPGNNVILTIDKDIQEAAYKSMTDNSRIGGLIAMKSNGEVLAWVSAPSFDPNEFATGISPQVWSKVINDPFKPLRNKVIQDHTSPGSTFKPFVALSALQEKIIGANTIVYAPGVLKFGRRPYHDHLRGGFGNISVFEAIERSSNVFFYKMGIALGIDNIAKYTKLLGIGERTGIELKREVPGLMPTSEWKKTAYGEEWQPGENLSNAIGQGFVLTSPIQMVVAYNAIGLEGLVYRPFLVKKVVDPDGKVLKENEPILVRDISQPQKNGVFISKANFKIVKEAMRRVANGERGTAKWWKIPGVEMAGKTGTSQVMSFSAEQIFSKCEQNPLHIRHHGWYVAWAPADKPEITVAMLAEHACHGSTGAAPIVRDVIKAYFEKNYPEIIAEAMKKKNHAQAPVSAPIIIEGE